MRAYNIHYSHSHSDVYSVRITEFCCCFVIPVDPIATSDSVMEMEERKRELNKNGKNTQTATAVVHILIGIYTACMNKKQTSDVAQSRSEQST